MSDPTYLRGLTRGAQRVLALRTVGRYLARCEGMDDSYAWERVRHFTTREGSLTPSIERALCRCLPRECVYPLSSDPDRAGEHLFRSPLPGFTLDDLVAIAAATFRRRFGCPPAAGTVFEALVAETLARPREPLEAELILLRLEES